MDNSTTVITEYIFDEMECVENIIEKIKEEGVTLFKKLEDIIIDEKILEQT